MRTFASKVSKGEKGVGSSPLRNRQGCPEKSLGIKKIFSFGRTGASGGSSTGRRGEESRADKNLAGKKKRGIKYGLPMAMSDGAHEGRA